MTSATGTSAANSQLGLRLSVTPIGVPPSLPYRGTYAAPQVDDWHSKSGPQEHSQYQDDLRATADGAQSRMFHLLLSKRSSAVAT